MNERIFKSKREEVTVSDDEEFESERLKLLKERVKLIKEMK